MLNIEGSTTIQLSNVMDAPHRHIKSNEDPSNKYLTEDNPPWHPTKTSPTPPTKDNPLATK